MTLFKSTRIKELDVAKGLAIILVVVGHICARSRPENNEWYFFLQKNIYSFHMPLFIFLAGITSFHLFERINNTSTYFTFLKNKFLYFGKNFLLLSSIIFCGKFLLQNNLYIDNSINQLGDFFVVFYDPLNSFSSFLWFIYTLFILYAITPLLLVAFKKRLLPIFILAVIIHFIPAPSLFTLSKIFLYFVFYFSGYIVACYYLIFIKHIKQYSIIYTITFLISLIVFNLYGVNVIQITAIPVTLLIACAFKESTLLGTLGKRSYIIYLYNTIFIGLTKAIMFLIIPWDGYQFIIYFFMLSFAGIAGPIYLQKSKSYVQKYIHSRHST